MLFGDSDKTADSFFNDSEISTLHLVIQETVVNQSYSIIRQLHVFV